jgi:hypothetical protein
VNKENAMWNRTITVMLALVFAGVVGSAAVVGAQGGDNLIHACVITASGQLRIVGDTETCRNNETPLSWPATAGGGARFLAYLANVNVTTLTNLNNQWDDIPGLSASFQTTTTGCIVATLSLEDSLVDGRHPTVRILIDNVAMEGQNTYLTAPEPAIALENQTHYTVWKCSVAAGSHIVKVQWRGGGDVGVTNNQVTFYGRTLVVEGQ